MKNKENAVPTPQLKPDSQSRVIAYSTAAGLGAFFAGQNAEAQVTESPAFAPYPATLIPGAGTGAYGFYHYFSVDGGANPQFNLTINNPIPPKPTTRVAQFIDLPGVVSSTNLSLTNLALTPVVSPLPPNAYLVPFLGGSIIDGDTNAAAPPTYQPRLAISYLEANAYGGFYNYLDSKYMTTGALGFQFVGSVDNQLHFGYMDVQVNTTTNSGGIIIVQSVVIQDMFYNAKPNAAITVPIQVSITNVTVGAGNAVTITFTSNDSAVASDFTLQTSPTLGASASWVDAAVSITQISSANTGGINEATYQAITTGTGGPSQFYRIVDSN
jgi:hypothetical protein